MWLEPGMTELKLYEGHKLSPFHVTLDDDNRLSEVLLDVKQTTHSSFWPVSVFKALTLTAVSTSLCLFYRKVSALPEIEIFCVAASVPHL